ncbi:MAG: preprotein translocase subunit YajC [Deltaproteobacteria bacterium]|jgi:preprotein translocase subunit YajC|nr:preprotein translocase subunit YajC [Deltaproteobacteria bacterium]
MKSVSLKFLQKDKNKVAERGRLPGLYLVLALLWTSCVADPNVQQEPMTVNNFIISTVLWFLAGLGIFWALVLKPQQIEQARKEEALNSLKKGVRVLTSGGLYGKVVEVSKEEIVVEIARGVEVKFHPEHVQPMAIPNNKGKVLK